MHSRQVQVRSYKYQLLKYLSFSGYSIRGFFEHAAFHIVFNCLECLFGGLTFLLWKNITVAKLYAAETLPYSRSICTVIEKDLIFEILHEIYLNIRIFRNLKSYLISLNRSIPVVSKVRMGTR